MDRWTIHPSDYGFDGIARDDLSGSTPNDNAQLITHMLEGRSSRGARAAVVLNAAAAIYVSGRVGSYSEGVKRAEASLDDGAGAKVLDRLRRAYTKPFATAT
jgi:anthranilate phosphoribosyltransferase